MKFHIRALGNWSKDLIKYVADKGVPQTQAGGGAGQGLKLTIHVEGPYGIPSVDFENAELYKTIMLVTGGIGVTPAQSLFNHFVHQYCEGRDIRKCIYLWSVKDRAMLTSIDDTRASHTNLPTDNQNQNNTGAGDDQAEAEAGATPLPLSFQPNLLDFRPPSSPRSVNGKYTHVAVGAANKVIPLPATSTDIETGTGTGTGVGTGTGTGVELTPLVVDGPVSASASASASGGSAR